MPERCLFLNSLSAAGRTLPPFFITIYRKIYDGNITLCCSDCVHDPVIRYRLSCCYTGFFLNKLVHYNWTSHFVHSVCTQVFQIHSVPQSVIKSNTWCNTCVLRCCQQQTCPAWRPQHQHQHQRVIIYQIISSTALAFQYKQRVRLTLQVLSPGLKSGPLLLVRKADRPRALSSGCAHPSTAAPRATRRGGYWASLPCTLTAREVPHGWRSS